MMFQPMTALQELKMSQQLYDEQGLLHAHFQRLPGQETDLLYFPIQNQITQNCPGSVRFGLTRVPVVGELLQVNRFLWRVEQVVHQQITEESGFGYLFDDLPERVAVVQISFHGAIG
jgi:hypothetical protein